MHNSQKPNNKHKMTLYVILYDQIHLETPSNQITMMIKYHEYHGNIIWTIIDIFQLSYK